MKQKVQDIDKELVEINKKPKETQSPAASKVKGPVKKVEKPVTKEDVAKTTEGMVKMDL